MRPPAAPRCRTSNETAGVGQGLSAKKTGVPLAETNSATVVAMPSGEAMIVADDDALARVLAAYYVTGDGLGYHACVREGEVFGDDAAPAISSKSNRSHCR